MSIAILGLLGGLGFAISGVPTAHRAWKDGKVSFIPRLTQWSVLLGAILTITYLILRNGFDWVISLDYLATILAWIIIIRYEYFPRK